MKRTRFLALLMTLCLLTGLASAEGCTICSGDAVCDTCGGLGYLEMKTLSGEMAQVACIGGCMDGKCPDCAVACDVCGSDGLCDTCGGLGYLEMKAYGSDEMLQIACTGENCAAGKCAVCGAGAKVAAVEEVVAEAVAADVPQGSYTFVEPEVEAAVRGVLGKETGDITYEDLLGITELYCSSAGLTSVEDFQFMPNLTHLSLSMNLSISDLSPLAGLTYLSELNLFWNDISDLSPLAGLTNLSVLKLASNNISDLSPLAGLTNLTVLELGTNEISDLSPLAGLTNLSVLKLALNNISDLSPLAGLTNLSELNLGSNDISDLSSLAGLTNLSELYLFSNNISDISPLAGLTNLRKLSLLDNGISDLWPLAGLTNLNLLALGENSISDITPLAGLINLSSLTLSYNQIADFSPLDGLKIATLDTDNNHPATPTPAPTATPSPYKAPIVGNDGLLVMSPEEYNDDIDDCDTIGQQDNYYTYRYINRGKVYDGDDAEWDNFEEYVDALADSGYYKVVANYDGEAGNTEAWYLEYTGPGSVRRTFKVNSDHKEKAAIVVQSFRGDVYVFYSLDVITNDIEDTQYRLNKYINVVNPWSASSSGSGGGGGSSGHWETVEEEVDCPSCTFGNCSICGGDGKYERYGEVVSCDPDCGSCDGKGKIKQRKQVWVND